MEPEFWRQRWQENKIGFHLEEVNPYLIEHWPRLAIKPGARVFVPLCGKSMDMAWLTAQGYEVEAVEVSELAIERFFEEQGLPYERKEEGQWVAYRSGNGAGSVRIWCGDFFNLEAQQLGPIDVVYDRASLIALPPEMRSQYVQKLLELTGSVPQFLITLSYNQSQMSGPPFSVEHAEVDELYQQAYGNVTGPSVEIDVLPSHGHFAARGLTALKECVYLLPVSAASLE